MDRLLITNAELRDFLHPGAPFERVVEHAFKRPGLLAKTEMFDVLPSDYTSFVFLDTDTFVLHDISLGCEKAEAHGIAAAQAAAYSLEHFWDFEKVLGGMGLRSRDVLQYNSGVIFFTRSPQAWQVLKQWHGFCSAAEAGAASWTDQPYLTLAMELHGFNPYTLSIAYNYRSFSEIANRRIRIWHSRTPPPPDVTEFGPEWPFRRFLNGRRLPEPQQASQSATTQTGTA